MSSCLHFRIVEVNEEESDGNVLQANIHFRRHKWGYINLEKRPVPIRETICFRFECKQNILVLHSTYPIK